jgi:hypothetical protein
MRETRIGYHPLKDLDTSNTSIDRTMINTALYFNLSLFLSASDRDTIWSLATSTDQKPGGIVTSLVEQLTSRGRPLAARPKTPGTRVRRTSCCFSIPKKYREPLGLISEQYGVSMGELVRRELPMTDARTQELSVHVIRAKNALPENIKKPAGGAPFCQSRFCRKDPKPHLMLWRHSWGDFYCCNCRATARPEALQEQLQLEA